MKKNCHRYMVLNAAKLLAADNLHGYANAVNSFETSLVAGALFADRAGPPLNIIVKHRIFGCGVAETHEEICNFASLNHYYDPETDAGLNLSEWGSLENIVELFALLILGGVYFPDLDVEPPLDFEHPYPSAASECQLHYDIALQKWQQGDSYGAFFELGWACHYITDVCTSPHTVSDKFIGHGDYEELADVCFGKEGYSLESVGIFPQDYEQKLTCYELVRAAARQTRRELQYYTQGKDSWAKGLELGLPRAEKMTACLIAKFLTAIQANLTCKPLKLMVTDLRDDTPIPGAFIFHRSYDDRRWQRIRTDAAGQCTLQLKNGEKYAVRPAFPGFKFFGAHGADNMEPEIGEFPDYRSPVTFTH